VLLCRNARTLSSVPERSPSSRSIDDRVVRSIAPASYFKRPLQFDPEAVLMRNASDFFLASPIGHIAWPIPTE
jgi:hypothetical protein